MSRRRQIGERSPVSGRSKVVCADQKRHRLRGLGNGALTLGELALRDDDGDLFMMVRHKDANHPAEMAGKDGIVTTLVGLDQLELELSFRWDCKCGRVYIVRAVRVKQFLDSGEPVIDLSDPQHKL